MPEHLLKLKIVAQIFTSLNCLIMILVTVFIKEEAGKWFSKAHIAV